MLLFCPRVALHKLSYYRLGIEDCSPGFISAHMSMHNRVHSGLFPQNSCGRSVMCTP
ncbi:uncharacterized protein EI90DRAFT_3050349 [Cantharellus anzutake]|uniref:uncharacterized protein n=1 Tax=Cantharellus anzutake TaxID=1750568 RepID=UPI001908C9A8|nr:uncharacterized protein EI90DRAFT_3050349 [Cantharellus anzutake]KAF8333936.1 hypothetical protein EI90DRAFT_3050349 [Cantharellus anzutake]